MIESLFTLPAYKMVVINLILILGYLCGYWLIKKIRPKQSFKPFTILILIGLLPLVSVFRAGTYESGDLSINAIKTLAFQEAIKEGYFIPRWAKDLNATYGYPNFIFAYPLPYYLASLIYWVVGDSIVAVKIVIILSFVCSGLAFYLWIKRHTSNYPMALVLTVKAIEHFLG